MMTVVEKTDAQKAEEAAKVKTAADTSGKAKAPDPSVTPTDAAKPPEGEKKTEGGEVEKPTVTLPAEDVVALQQRVEKLESLRARSSAEADRERGRTRKARADLSEARKTPSSELQQALTAETLADAMVSALEKARPTGKQPVIAGLRYEADDEVTFNGRPIDPDVAEILVQSRQRGDTLSETVKELKAGLEKINARFETEDSEREAAELRELEDTHITQMEEFGVSLCDQTFSEYDENVQELARENYYAKLGRLLHGLDQRGVNPEQITPDLISRMSQPIIERLEQRFEGIAPKGQKTRADEARKDAPLKRGGSAAEPGRPDPEKMTPEEREADLDKLATELAEKHQIGRHKPKVTAGPGRAAY